MLILLQIEYLDLFFEGDFLDDTDGDSLAHITHSETSKRREGLEGLNSHGLGRGQDGDASITVLDGLGVLLEDLTGTAVHLLLELSELASDVGGVAIEHRGVSSVDLARVVEYNHLSAHRVRRPHRQINVETARGVVTTCMPRQPARRGTCRCQPEQYADLPII